MLCERAYRLDNRPFNVREVGQICKISPNGADNNLRVPQQKKNENELANFNAIESSYSSSFGIGSKPDKK
jgi:hypothetical protein